MFGTVSCTEDESMDPIVTEEFKKMPSPILKSSSNSKTQSVEVKAMTEELPLEWSLSDELVFPDPGDFDRVNISSRCLLEDRELADHKQLPTKDVKLMQIFNKDLTILLQNQTVICNLDFQALSPAGHKHNFSIHRLKLNGPTNHEIKLFSNEKDKAIESMEWIDDSKLSTVRLDLDRSVKSIVKVFCREHQYSTPFDSSSLRTLADFQFETPFSLTEQDPLKPKSLSDQCRLISFNEIGAHQISDWFRIYKPSQELRFQLSFPQRLGWDQLEPIRKPAIQSLFHYPQGLKIGGLHVENLSDYEQFLELPLALPVKVIGAVTEAPVDFKGTICDVHYGATLSLEGYPTTATGVEMIKVRPHSSITYYYFLKIPPHQTHIMARDQFLISLSPISISSHIPSIESGSSTQSLSHPDVHFTPRPFPIEDKYLKSCIYK